MKNNILTRKLDKLGRITIPANFRKNLNIDDLEELEIISGSNNIIIRKQINPDIFGNIDEDDNYFEYYGNRISKNSIIELSKIAGLM